MTRQFLNGDRVRTPQGKGTIVCGLYGPSFGLPIAYRVSVDDGDPAATVDARDVRSDPTHDWPAPTTADGGYTVGDALGFPRPEPVSTPLQTAADPANTQLTPKGVKP